jgi:uncharacterized phosphosugar-binding protein
LWFPVLHAEDKVNETKKDGITERVHAAALDWLDDYIKKNRNEELVPIAEAIADRLIAGGTIWVAGDPAFADELNFRAGGLAGIKVFAQGQKFEKSDVLIVGQLACNDRATRVFHPAFIGQAYGPYRNVLTIHIGSHNWPQVARVDEMTKKERWSQGFYSIDTSSPEGESWDAIAVGQMSTVAIAWSLECEIVSALSRKGKTTAVLGSIFAPGANEWDEKIKGKFILDEPKVEAIAAGKLSRDYLAICRRQIAAFADAAQLRKAAQRLADCQNRKGVIWTVMEGHVHTRGAIVPKELSQLLVYGPAWEWEAPPQGLHPNDTLLFFGYIKYPKEVVETSVKAGADAVVLVVDEGVNDEKTTSIRSNWERWDGAVEIPNYPYKAAPSSAVVTTMQWYSLMAEAQALLKK